MKKLLLLLVLTISLFSNNLTLEERKEAKQGKEVFDKILKESKISKDLKTLKKIKKIGLRLAKFIDKDYEWEFALIEDNQINAFCLPGGKVVFFTGIFKVIENNDQLAAIMSHEIAHVILRHAHLRAVTDSILTIPQTVGKDLLGDLIPKDLHPLLDTVYKIGKNLTLLMPYDREQESEADRKGIQLMHKAGYNPHAAIKLWKNINAISQDDMPEFLSTHPSNDERIRVIEDEIKILN